MKHLVPRPLLIPAAAVFAACSGLFPSSGSGGDRIKSPHGPHAQTSCVTCHAGIPDADELGDPTALPKEAGCLACHQDGKTSGKCGSCHANGGRPATYAKRTYHLRFAHSNHVPKAKGDCAACHEILSNADEPGRPPAMAICLGCHEHERTYADGKCNVCHLDLSRYPLRPISSFTHQGEWLLRHAQVARPTVDQCSLCHEQTFCTECHAKTASTRTDLRFPERPDRDFIHRGDFVSRHAVEARAGPATCQRCHGERICESCHAANNLSPGSPNPRNPHPRNWTNVGSRDFHGDAARRDILSCAACHDEGPASVCVLCHKVGGVGGNPHPTYWLQRHDRDEIQRTPMCLFCHP